MYNVKRILLSYILLLQASYAVAQKVVLIVDTGMGYNDFEDIPNSSVNRLLPYSIADFTVAAADTKASYAAFITGKLQLSADPIQNIPTPNIHSITLQANINTGHFGVWNFTTSPNTNENKITVDPEITIDSALSFINGKTNYFVTIFMPPLSDLYVPRNSPLRSGGVYPFPVICYDKKQTAQEQCPRGPYVSMIRYKDNLLAKLLGALRDDNAFIAWSAAHGGIDAHTDALSAPKTSLRGGQYSLFDGGIRTRFRYFTSGEKLQNAGNAIDLAPTIASMFKISMLESNGINLLDLSATRQINLRWRTNSRAEGHCINTSPMFAEKVTINNKAYKFLYDANPKNDQIYEWNSGFEFQTEAVNYPITSRPSTTLETCKYPANIGVKNNLTKKAPLKGIIFVMLDDIGYGDIKYFSKLGKGRNYPDTPNLDQLAKQNLVLTDFHSAATVCTPTRTAAFTGRHPSNKFNPVRGVYRHTITGSAEALQPQYLGVVGSRYFSTTFFKSKGWGVGHFGKLHIYDPRTRLTPEFYDIDADGYKCHSCYAPQNKMYDMTSPFYQKYSAQIITNDSLNWLDKQKAKNKNFFLNIWYSNMHTPFMVEKGQLPPLGFGNDQNPYLLNQSMIFTKETPLQVYNGLFKYLDKEIGRIFTWLKTKDLDDKVLFVFHADNGPEEQAIGDNSVGEQALFRGRKRSNYEGGHRFPAIIKWGNALSGSIDVLGATYDFFPTFVSLAGYDVTKIPGYATLDGVDLSPCILNGQCEQFRERVLRWESVWPNRGDCLGVAPRFAVRWGNYSCLAESTQNTALRNIGLKGIQCYDLSKDILQSNNLATSNPALVQRFRELLVAWPNYDTKYLPKDIKEHPGSYAGANMRAGFKC